MSEPRNPEFEAATRRAFAQQGMMETLGATLDRCTPGHCIISAPITPEVAQQDGFAHAGLGWTIGDSAAGFAAFTLLEAGARILTIEMKINLMAPARGERLIAEGQVIRAGRTITTVKSDIYAEGDASTRTHVATMLGTMMAIRA